MDNVTNVILAGLNEEALMKTAYPAFAAAGLSVTAVVDTGEKLAQIAGAFSGNGVVVVEANLYPTPSEAVAELAALVPARVVVILPQNWRDRQDEFATLPNLMGGHTAPVSWAQVAGHCNTLNTQGGTAQVVRITKTLTIRGGYTVTNWTTPDPADNSTILDAGGAGTVLHISGDIAPAIEGLHITGGASDAFHGAGVHNDGSDSTLFNVTISDNVAWDLGGGIYNLNGGDMTLTDVVIRDNDAWPAHPYGFGGGMYNHHSNATLTNVVFYNNRASKGGGIANDHSHPTLTNVTLTDNWAIFGGGVYDRYSSPSLTNCIVWDNSPENIFNASGTGSNPAITYSDIEGGYAGTGNIDADPLFVDAASGDLRLQSTSPAIDAGDNDAVSVTIDLDGHPRRTDVAAVADSGNGTAPIVDMGAYEYYSRSLAIAKSTPIVVSNTGQEAASGVLIIDAVPAGANYLSGGVESDGVVTWSGLVIDAGDVATATFTVTTCQASLTNEWYRVLTSTKGVTTAWGAPLVTDLAPPAIDVDLYFSPTTVFSGEMVDFDAASSSDGSSIVGWQWDFGDGGMGSGSAVTHTYTAAGAYTVTLLVSDACGYTAATSRTVHVTGTPFVPIYGVDLTPPSMAASGGPDDDVTYNLWIVNSGSVADTFGVDIEGNAWTTVAEPATVNLQPSEMRKITVTVSVAYMAKYGDADVITVTATSWTSPTMKKSSVLTTSADTRSVDLARVYLPLMVRDYSEPPTIHELEDAPSACPGHDVEVGKHLYRDDFDVLNDHDWYSFEAVAGQTYTDTDVRVGDPRGYVHRALRGRLHDRSGRARRRRLAGRRGVAHRLDCADQWDISRGRAPLQLAGTRQRHRLYVRCAVRCSGGSGWRPSSPRSTAPRQAVATGRAVEV